MWHYLVELTASVGQQVGEQSSAGKLWVTSAVKRIYPRTRRRTNLFSPLSDERSQINTLLNPQRAEPSPWALTSRHKAPPPVLWLAERGRCSLFNWFIWCKKDNGKRSKRKSFLQIIFVWVLFIFLGFIINKTEKCFT